MLLFRDAGALLGDSLPILVSYSQIEGRRDSRHAHEHEPGVEGARWFASYRQRSLTERRTTYCFPHDDYLNNY